MAKLKRYLRCSDEEVDALQYRLCEVAERFVTLHAETFTKHTDGKRIAWLDKNIIGPATKLSDAIRHDNWPLLSDVDDSNVLVRFDVVRSTRAGLPQSRAEVGYPSLADKLDWLIEDARDLQHRLRQRNVRAGTAFRSDVVFALTCVFVQTFPERTPTRIVDKGHPDVRGEFPEFVKMAAEPILGPNEPLDSQIQSAVHAFNEDPGSFGRRFPS